MVNLHPSVKITSKKKEFAGTFQNDVNLNHILPKSNYNITSRGAKEFASDSKLYKTAPKTISIIKQFKTAPKTISIKQFYHENERVKNSDFSF